MSKPKETFLLRVEKGRLVPDDSGTVERMRDKGYHVGDVLSATLRKARNPGFHRLAHVFGKLVADNIERFSGWDAHKVLKAIQFEADIECERMMVLLDGFGMVEVKIPQSLSFENMDDGVFHQVFRRMCEHVAETYWTDCTPEQIEQMAQAMPEAA